MKRYLEIIGCCFLLATAQTHATVMNVIQFQGDVTAGDAGSDTASYNESGTPGAPINAAETASAVDPEASRIGLAAAVGFASSDANQLGFSQQSAGLGEHSSVATTRLSQSITNTGTAAGIGTVTSEILAGEVSLGTLGQNQITDFNGSASFSFDITLDGMDLFAFSGSITEEGIMQSNTGFLNGLQLVNQGNLISLSWEATSLELDLGTFAAGQTRVLDFTLNTQTSDTVGCAVLDIALCLSASSSIGDPNDGGFGYITLFSIAFDPDDIFDVPEPSSMGLLLLSAIGLMVGSRRKRYSTKAQRTS